MQSIHLAPARCSECGQLFDLSVDAMGSSREAAIVNALRIAARARRKVVCEDCQN